MARRGVPEINAGSMADIAFLLLIFFLVTTTIDHEEGILRILPQKTPPEQIEPIEFKKRNVFMVYTNKNDELLVEDELIEIEQLRGMCIDWFGNPRSGADIPDIPKRVLVDEARAQKNIAEWKGIYERNPDDVAAKQKVSLWEDKLMAVREIGPYYELPKSALIAFQSDNGTSYGFYIRIQDELTLAIDELRNEFSEREFGVSLDVLEEADPEANPEYADYFRILELVYPSRISETTKGAQ